MAAVEGAHTKEQLAGPAVPVAAVVVLLLLEPEDHQYLVRDVRVIQGSHLGATAAVQVSTPTAEVAAVELVARASPLQIIQVPTAATAFSPR